MFEVICEDASNQPEGGELIKGEVYLVESEFVNFYDQKTYIIKGIKNSGTTKLGMNWNGYRADRFSLLSNNKAYEKEEAMSYILN